MSRDVFYPRDSLEGRSNFKRYFRIERDGSITEYVLLNIVDKRQRESVICTHFLQFLVQHIIKDDVGINILSRDQPWDFQLELSTGETFHLEIVSIADNRLQFEVSSREDMRARNSQSENLRLRDLRKIADLFPDDQLSQKIEAYERDGILPNDLVTNPLHNEGKTILVAAGLPPEAPLSELIDRAIKTKEDKGHGKKENTILIIDNRTSTYYVDDMTNALETISERLSESPFKEIWLYTGYCSDWDGNNGQYTIIAVKAPNEKLERLIQPK